MLSGNDNLHNLTTAGNTMYTLRVDMQDFSNESRYAEYNGFRVDSASNFYQLHVTFFNGDVGELRVNSRIQLSLRPHINIFDQFLVSTCFPGLCPCTRNSVESIESLISMKIPEWLLDVGNFCSHKPAKRQISREVGSREPAPVSRWSSREKPAPTDRRSRLCRNSAHKTSYYMPQLQPLCCSGTDVPQMDEDGWWMDDYPRWMKARVMPVSPVQSIEPHRIIGTYLGLGSRTSGPQSIVN